MMEIYDRVSLKKIFQTAEPNLRSTSLHGPLVTRATIVLAFMISGDGSSEPNASRRLHWVHWGVPLYL